MLVLRNIESSIVQHSTWFTTVTNSPLGNYSVKRPHVPDGLLCLSPPGGLVAVD